MSEDVEALQETLIRIMAETLTRLPCEACGAKSASAADIANVRQFLKDNGFTVDPVKESDALDNLIEARKKAGFPSIEDVTLPS